MNVDFLNPIDSTSDEVKKELENFSIKEVLIGCGQVLGHNLLSNKIDKDLNIVTIIPLVRLALEVKTLEETRELTFGDLRHLCRKSASFNQIRRSDQQVGQGKAKFNQDDLIDFLVRSEMFQAPLQEDMSLVLSRVYIFLYELEEEWGGIDPDEKIKEVFGVKFHTLYIIFFGIIANLSKDIEIFPGVDFNTHFQNADQTIIDQLEDIKKIFEKNSARNLDEIKKVLEGGDFDYQDDIMLSSLPSPLEDRPFVKISEERFILPVPHFVINRMLDHLYLSLNSFEVNLRKEQGRSDPYKTDFSKTYGNVVEKYVIRLLNSLGVPFEEEPLYKGSKNRGPDVVCHSENIIIEVSKFVPNKSLRVVANSDSLEECYQKVIKKFKQSFNWFKSYCGKFKNIFPSNVIFVVVTAEPFPCMQFSFGAKILSNLLDDEWKQFFANKKRPKCLVLSLTEVEILMTVHQKKGKKIRAILESYLSYLHREGDQNPYNQNLKYTMKQFLLNEYDVKGNHLEFHKEAFEKLQEVGNKAFFGDRD